MVVLRSKRFQEPEAGTVRVGEQCCVHHVLLKFLMTVFSAPNVVPVKICQRQVCHHSLGCLEQRFLAVVVLVLSVGMQSGNKGNNNRLSMREYRMT
tara:strand:- start:1141 stop:1428 length:288 start_codon:yes stop_codon:yes gene_type:complete